MKRIKNKFTSLIIKKEEMQKPPEVKPQPAIDDEQREPRKIVFKKETENTLKKNHYLDKKKLTANLIKYRRDYACYRLFKCHNDVCKAVHHELLISLKHQKDILSLQFECACKGLLNSNKYRYNPQHLKDDMLQHALTQMYCYNYFYKFNIRKTKEGFSWMTSIAANFFQQVIDMSKDHFSLRMNFRTSKIFEFENTNIETDLSDITVGSMVKGIRYSFEDMSEEE